MKKCIFSSIFIISFQVFCIHAWSAEKDANLTKDLLSNNNTIKLISIQVASLNDEKKASQELARLKSRGLEAFMRHETVGDKGMWYRVYVGQFTSRKKATLFAQKIKNQGIITDFWVKTITIAKEPEKTPLAVAKPTEQPKMKSYDAKSGPDLARAPIELLAPPPPLEEIPIIAQLPIESEKTPTPIKSQETPSKVPEESIQEPAQAPTTAEKETIKTIEPPEAISDTEKVGKLQSIAVQAPEEQTGTGRFSLGLRSSYFSASKAENFIIERHGTSSDAWSFQNDRIFSAITSSFRLSDKFSLDVSIEKAFFTNLDLWHLSMGPKFNFRKINILTPYLRGGVVIGHLEWDDAPGDFEPGLGFEGGFGLSLIRSNIQFGIEAAYRVIKYDYNTPSDTEVTASDDELDLSGYAVSATLSYQF